MGYLSTHEQVQIQGSTFGLMLEYVACDSEHCIFWKPDGLQARAFYSTQCARRYAEGADLAVREG